jgi:hypothetical protein
MSINGDFAQGSNGKLEVIIGSNSQPAALNISGTAALAGRLEVKLAAGYTPPAGTSFPILSAAECHRRFRAGHRRRRQLRPERRDGYRPTGNTNALQMTSAVSRKTHGSADTFDIPLPGVECRQTSGNHTLVFTFSNTIATGSVSVVGGSASITEAPTINGNTMTVNLTNVANVQQVQIELRGITDVFSQALADASIPVKFLIGDTNGDSTVNSGDAIQTRSRSGQATNAANFRSDVNADGTVNAGDALAVRSRSGTSLP